MRKVFVLVLILLFVINLNFASSAVDSEIQKITDYAEDFETGNINYIQLLVYSSAVRERVNAALGATNREMGGILKEEQLRSVLGEPTEKTKWAWVENEEREMKLDKEVPAWRKIIFDGNKIQIWINSWPSIFKKAEENTLIYRLNFEINFKEPQEELNIESKISEIKTLAEDFNRDSSRENAEILAKESVNAEKTFERYMRQNSGKCEDIMKGVFGAENKRESQKMLVQEITFHEGKNFDAIARIEMCDECEWRWINLEMWINWRGAGFKMPKQQEEFFSGQFQNLDSLEYKKQVSEILNEAKSSLKQGDYVKFFSLNSKMRAINEAWNQKSNDIWPEVDKMFPSFESLSPEQQSKLEEYWWIKQEQQKREKMREIVKNNYQDRKEFYLSLFSQYEKKEFYFSQVEYEKRLVEEFKEFGKETCDNNLDDNKNGEIDCSDEQCLGKRCGRQKFSIQKENETLEEERDLFCIEKSCQLREEIIQEERSICGNHICEKNEIESCKEDCIKCAVYDAVNCSGKVIFEGKDKEGCPLKPICLEETDYCEKNEDCIQPLCGIAECVERKCRTIGLEECKEAECNDGEEKIQNCDNDEEIIVGLCQEGLWKRTGVECKFLKEENESVEQPIVIEEPITGNECQVKEDCGNENDVCSNGRCVILPEVIRQPEPAHLEQSQQEQPQETPNEQQPATDQQQTSVIENIVSSIQAITGRITGFVIGLTADAEEAVQQEPLQPEPTQEQPQETPSPMQEQQPPPPEDDREQREIQERENRAREEKERRENECRNNCDRECKDRLISPCVGDCVRNSQCKEANCVDEEIKKCETSCKQEKGFDKCAEDCQNKCMIGEHLEIEEQREEHKEEKGVFKAGGMCRTAQGSQKTEAFIFFDGWGEPFNQIQPLKQKYYSGGNADWCKKELENLLKQRKELEQGLNQDFAAWFFEKYLANSADEWEQHVSGIFELYWRDVELSKQIAERMNCLDIGEMPQYNLINVKYEADYGRLELWEEIKKVKLPSLENEMQIVSPYMMVWIFPPKSFIIYEMKQSMKNHEFPGPPEQKLERENEEGPTAEEREVIKQDKKFMKQIKKISEKYGGNLDAVIRFVDNGTVVFNLYVQVNEDDILKIKPMLPEEVPQEDIRIDIEFQKIYDMIYIQEKDMRGGRIESPPWDRKTQPIQKIKEVVNGVKMYFIVTDILNSAKVYPETSEKDVKALIKSFFSMMMKSEKGGPEMETEMKKEDIGEEKGVWEDKEKITGEVIR